MKLPKTILKASVFLGAFFMFFSACRNIPDSALSSGYYKITGKAQGTSYSLTYRDSAGRDFKAAVDSVLLQIDSSLSTYKQNTVITNFNNSDSGAVIDVLFRRMLTMSWQVFKMSDGAFDPSINPLLSFWGFNEAKIEHPDTIDPNKVEHALALKGFDQLVFEYGKHRVAVKDLVASSHAGPGFLRKPFPGFQLNFNAIAQGYSVDVLANWLEQKGVKNYLVELGGETKVKGANLEGSDWRMGIDKPVEPGEERALHAVVSVRSGALATSGSYRKFYMKDGKKYPHTIDPKTGYPVDHHLLSATVYAPDSWLADGLATACMVNGTEWSKQLAGNNEGIEVYLIYDNHGKTETYVSEGLQAMLKELP